MMYAFTMKKKQTLLFRIIVWVNLFILSSCIYSPQQTAEELIDQLPQYEDDIVIYWISGTPEPWRRIKTIGELKLVLTPEQVGETSIKNGNHPLFWVANPTPGTCIYFGGESPYRYRKKKKSFYAVLDTVLEKGSSPQCTVRDIDETTFLIHIKHGLDARKQMNYLYYGGGTRTDYPLIWPLASITFPVLEWFLKNGASPNQQSKENHLTPYTNLHYYMKNAPMISHHVHETNYTLRYYRTAEGTKKMEELLKQYGATDVPN